MITLPWFYTVGASVLSLGGGFLIYHLTNKSVRQKVALQKQIKEMQYEMKDYKKKIAGHLSRTASLLEATNSSYSVLREHLTNGSEDLLKETTLPTKIEDLKLPEEEPVAQQPTVQNVNNFYDEDEDEDNYDFKSHEKETNRRELDFNSNDDFESDFDENNFENEFSDDFSHYEESPLEKVRSDLDSLLDDPSHQRHNKKDYAHIDH